MTVPAVDWTALLTPPAGAERAQPPTAWTGDTAAVDQIAEHFNAPGFELAVKEGVEDKAPLSEREMMFLVSHHIPGATQAHIKLTSSQGRR